MGNELTVTILCDNLVYRPCLLAEHGFSALIEVRDGDRSFDVLFDTGQGLTLLHNAAALEVELARVAAVVLSHGHYDHTGGLSDLAAHSSQGLSVFAHPGIFRKKFQQEKNGRLRPTGISWKREELEEKGVRFFLSKENKEILPGVFVSGEITSPGKGRGLEDALLERDGQLVRDDFGDEVALFVATRRGLVVFVGCGHPGLGRILEAAVEVAGKKGIYALIGGFHLVRASSEEIEATSRTVKGFGVKEVVLCHCTGYRAREIFRNDFQEGCHMGEVGFIWSC
ncbi:MAG TPA: MBL fold metallo-hydrolase [Peptococcaceae bacterium]|nr:MBL fold metallo-hydrolase [Peptococcaceae bacterium]